VGDDFNDYAREVAQKLRESDVRVEVDTDDETVGYKIRQAETQKIPYMLVVGGREEEDGTVSVRSHADGQQDTVTVEAFLDQRGDEFEPTLD
jgi:threonyl-tRNA synthetase